MATPTKFYEPIDIRNLLETSDKAVARALVALYERQTAEEQVTDTTKENNGRGYNGVDAPFCSSLARQILNHWTLSPKQLAAARKVLVKYARQLADIANAKTAAANGNIILEPVVKTVPAWIQKSARDGIENDIENGSQLRMAF